ncbi:acetyl-CoA hydrolase [Veillonella montpellierensis DNF00314]|uniref:Acetyl-CoA hydrolase n=1 Tax=Veillonella montpellierensis DNF00314 TaxID=1401067 RepID=A0A096AM16_9FIRM|nr:acetyl-CoA hydrolase/transferase family protein [Veillonella montpellierensis]KGF47795.1 acetyl-CoA hydrolase [Veillonella montpellierensis DNF00314]
MINILDRVKGSSLQGKIVTAEEAAKLINPGDKVGISGFTPSGYAKAVPLALAKRMESDPFQIDLWTGASVGDEADGALARVNGIHRRFPYQTNKDMRNALNNEQVRYSDMHLSHVAQQIRYGFYGDCDVAIVEAACINEDGSIVPTTSVGNSPTFVSQAKKVIVEVNVSQPLTLVGMHDIYEPLDPPHRQPIPLVTAGDRIGTDAIPCDPSKIVAIVPCDIPDTTRPLAPIDDDAKKMSGHLIEFFKNEIKQGRLPENLLPLQSGVGSVANAVISGLAQGPFKDLSIYTEVIQDGMFDLIDAGKVNVCSGTALSPSPDGLKRFYANIDEYRKKIILRPQEISNNPGLARRLGVIAMNTAIEFDITGNVNSTHIMGSKMMNGIGGSGDFARNAYISIFCTNSVAKNGDISSIVPMCSHIDHTEHDVLVFCTEQGIADVRGMSPIERARTIIKNCAHPDYKPMLEDYLERAIVATKHAHTPMLLDEALSWHKRFTETGTMKIKK